MNQTNVSVIGLGAMGTALARALLGGGSATTVWNRSSAKAKPLAAKGARLAASVGDAVRASPLTILCVLDYEAARQVLEAAGDGLAGRVIVNLTNGTPEEARNLARWVEGRGARYVDGGIMAVPPMIGGEGALILYSGCREAFEAHGETLQVLGAARFLGADPGLAPLYDLALLAAMYGLFGGFLHASALAGSEGGRAGDFVALAVPWLEAMTAALPEMARQIDTRDYAAGAASGLAMQRVALDNILAAGRAQGVRPDLLQPVRDLVAKRVTEGHDAEDVAGVVELIRGAPPAA